MGKRGEHGRIGLTGDHRLEDGAAARSNHVAQHRGELDVGVLQRLLQALDVAGLLTDELLARAQQRPQCLGGRLGNETRPDQPVRQQLGQPRRVPNIGFPPRHVLDVRRIRQDERHLTVGKNVPDRLPIDARRFHRHMCAPVLGQPSREVEEAARRRPEGPHFGRYFGPAGHANAANNRVLVHIQSGTARINNFHPILLCAAGVEPPFREV